MRPIEREMKLLTKNRWPFSMNLFSASTRIQFCFCDNIGERSEAWSVLSKRFQNFERPRLQRLIPDLTNLRKNNNESIVD